MIQGFIKIEEEILKNPDLSVKQRVTRNSKSDPSEIPDPSLPGSNYLKNDSQAPSMLILQATLMLKSSIN